ncbi:hypothetical protein [Desertivirga arenae]|uniref:hypothetical protein n=1 Tax=Desertivirga arenae TaxID=2810309 RepID=UPI001A9755CC|nr:hypothetical protein [Pedobacter sp. SYSU D00823]
MKKFTETKIVKLTEKFDRQLLKILNNELKAVKEAKEQIIKTLKPGSDDGLLVA